MELYTRRSISECLSSGWTLLSTNIGRIAKSMWWPTLLMVVFSCITAPTCFIIEKHNIQHDVTPLDAILSLVILLGIIGIYIVFSAKIFKLQNEQTTRFCISRMAKVTGLYFGVAILSITPLMVIVAGLFAIIASGKVAEGVGMGIFAFVYLLWIIGTIVVFSPINYVGVKYMIEPKMKLKDTWKSYKRGWKSIGTIIGFMLLSSLIIFIAQCIISLPGVIAMIATSLSLQGIALGDPSGLPSSFMAILGITSGISCFITCILLIWFTLSEYYLYGSIEAKYRS